MFRTITTLFAGANARAEDRVRQAFSIELIDQKIREAQASQQAAKATLASLIQRQRTEDRLAEGLARQTRDLVARAQAAMDDGNEAMAAEAASAVAQIENELAVRTATADRLAQKIVRLRSAIEAGHRRIIDLKQGAITAKAIRAEQHAQKRLNSTLSGRSSVAQAEELIANILAEDDPFEQSQILQDIDRGLDHSDLPDRMAEAGYGNATKITTADVLSRLKSKAKPE
ncbi:MAG: PspA/IM30 family protein [Alphaproteobacteria bacterium]|nr:PspA/IM30 family protein [Alphaproteobacteria bacterium]NNF23662.1 PspA/IM30 family protein [Paracoccaceae bacterium]